MPVRPLHLVVTGPQGSGKGTQSDRLAATLGLLHISSGDLLRRAARDDGGDGELVRSYLDAGALVPPSVVDRLVIAAIRTSPTGWVLDGYPRTLAQAEVLDRLVDVDAVLELHLSFDVARARLAARRVCDRCGRTSAVPHPALVVACPSCREPMVRRTDDEDHHALSARLASYELATMPVLDHYRSRGVLRSVDADGTVDEVAARVLTAVLTRRTARVAS